MLDKETALDRIFAALGDKVHRTDTERSDLPVRLVHDDLIPVSGSVIIGTKRIISRSAVNQMLDKELKL